MTTWINMTPIGKPWIRIELTSKAEWRDIGRDTLESCLVRPGWNSSRGADLWNYGVLEWLEIQWKSNAWRFMTSAEVFLLLWFFHIRDMDATWFFTSTVKVDCLGTAWCFGCFGPSCFPVDLRRKKGPCEIPVSSHMFGGRRPSYLVHKKTNLNCQLAWNVSCEYWSKCLL